MTWRTVRIEEIAVKIAMGPFGSSIKVDSFVKSGVPIISGQHLHKSRLDESSGFNFVSIEHARKLSNSNVYPGDIIFTHAGTIGQVSLIPADAAYERYVISQRQFYLRVDLKKADPAFITRWFHGPIGRHRLLANSSQVGVPSISRPSSNLKRIEIDLPSLDEQKAISRVLDTLDDKIEMNQRMNETLEAMARAIFRDWFVDFGPARAKMDGRKPYLAPDIWSLFPDRLDDEGKPEGWAPAPLIDLVQFNPTEPLARGVEAPYIDMAALPTAGPNTEPWRLREFASGTRFRNGDTLLARITPCLENGKTALVHGLPDGAVGWGSTEFIVMRARAPVSRAVPYLIARDPTFRAHAIRSMTGTSGRQRASTEAIAVYQVTTPGVNEIWSRFAEIADPIFERIAQNDREDRTLAATRDLLLPKLISGEIRIRDAENMAGGAM